MERFVLLNPGPVNVSPRVQQSLTRGDLCHREAEFSDLSDAIRAKVVKAFGSAAYSVVLLSGSGTLAVEAMVSSAVPDGKKLLVINNGVYGDRISQMADAHNIPYEELRFEWMLPPDLDQIEAALERDPSIAAVAAVHHETTTGLINPVAEIGNIVRRRDRRFLLDAVSSLGGEDLDFERDHVDLCACTANKCIQGLPGVSFVVGKKEVLRSMGGYSRRSLYLNLPLHWEAQERSGTPFTPAVPAWYALDEAMDELLEETVVGRVRRYSNAAHFLRQGFSRMGLECFVPEKLRSNTLTSLTLPPGMSYIHLHDSLKERGFVIYAGQGKLQTSVFRVANMGHLQKEDFRRFLVQLENIILNQK